MRPGLALVASLAVVLWLIGSSARPAPKPGEVAPSWSGTSLVGKAVKSTSYRGKAVLINFFSRY